MGWAIYVGFGAAFGFVLSRSGAADYDFIQQMFLFESFQLYGILGSAVLVTATGLRMLGRLGHRASGQPLSISQKPRHPGNVIGGVFFGVGWAITGMCPGPIFVNIGEGKLYALGALAGGLVGAALFGALYERLSRPMHLPELPLGASAEKR